MTLREDQLLQVQGSQKGRSASFCVGGEGEPPGGVPADWAAPAAPRDLAAAARRSQSCRVQGARPRVRRRDKKGEALDLADAASTGCLTQGEPSYHPFLHKAPSCGKVFYQTVDGTVMQTYTPEGSPGGARRARRPPLPNVGTPEDSPALARRPTRTRALAGASQGRGSPSSRYKQRALEPDPEDPDAYRLRNFSLTAKGIVNRGDSFRVRRSSVQSGSAMPSTSPVPAPAAAAPPSPPPQPVSSFSVALLGATGVGKTALIDQFMSSECTNAYDRDRGVEFVVPVLDLSGLATAGDRAELELGEPELGQSGAGVELEGVKIDLSGGLLTSLPRSLLARRSILTTHLYLTGNRLRSLPDSLGSCLPLLTYLDVRDNLLDTLPAAIAQLAHLQVLLLQDNRISVLPPQLAALDVSPCADPAGQTSAGRSPGDPAGGQRRTLRLAVSMPGLEGQAGSALVSVPAPPPTEQHRQQQQRQQQQRPGPAAGPAETGAERRQRTAETSPKKLEPDDRQLQLRKLERQRRLWLLQRQSLSPHQHASDTRSAAASNPSQPL
ncbi:Ras guanine nucleotide exchange factor L [Amphibalanus amphitrite]|uniref:Ras guanine nucleotide exchange factor L n=1 Tax=Amphibalanus amphitrite TaxID=1232801 RepID=A0A6A4WWB6_AMPAM|nr:Ras guanine nucleotide exchange factor L [Amphibalanus amphitrite]